MVSEILKCVLWYLILIWGNSQSILFQICLLFLSSHISNKQVFYLLYFPILGYSLPFFFYLLSSLDSFCWRILKIIDSFFSCVYSIKSSSKTLFISITAFSLFLEFLLYSFLDFLFLHLYYPSVLICCLLFQSPPIGIFRLTNFTQKSPFNMLPYAPFCIYKTTSLSCPHDRTNINLN